jgi:type II restriction enzyme
MIERLTSSDNPNLFLLNYEPLSLVVTNFLVIPKHFFTPEIIEKRRPLSPKAERAGWVGCNILLKPIPQSGKIFFVRDGSVEPKAKVQSAWQKTLFLRQTEDVAARGWLLDVMRCIERLGKSEFALADVYGFERDLEKLHPSNRHIKDKIRQQLQILRDKNYLDFVARGLYRQTR